MRVKMVNSVGEYVAGEEYELDDATADNLVLKGYAEGALSREYRPDEVAEIRACHQTVNV